jgi:PAT family beta-lactamase induction signal transducer AmpG
MNLLDSKPGRLVAFGALYLSEGLPGGFLMMAIATEIQRRGMEEPAVYGAFVSMLALPWIWKFMMGPLVDNIRLKRFGARKQWIVMAQSTMLIALGAALLQLPDQIEIPKVDGSGFFATVESLYLSGIGLFAGLLFLHNFFAATQDVAIDALACQILREDERGLANGVMFSCTHAGYLIGGSGVLWLKSSVGSFEASGLFVLGLMASILLGVIFFIKEKSAAQEIADGELPAPEEGHSGWRAAIEQMVDYLKTTWKSVILSKNGFLTTILALMPIGALALSMLLSALMAPRLGMTDNEIAALNTASTAVFIPFCLLGGWLSDRFNRRLILAITASMTVIPSIWIGLQFKQAGWDHPPMAGEGGMWPREEALIASWWIATLAFSVFNGLKYAVKTAFYMDIVTPKIAATQFTALMAMTNLTNIYSKVWQSQALDTINGWNWTVSKLLFVDAAIGLLFLLILFFIKPTNEEKKISEIPA